MTSTKLEKLFAIGVYIAFLLELRLMWERSDRQLRRNIAKFESEHLLSSSV
jgi:hypothetical protein